MWVMSGRPFDSRNNDYVTVFHFAGRPPVKDLQLCATDMAVRLTQCTTAYRHTDATDSPMFSWVADVQCANWPNSSIMSQISSCVFTIG